jgi:ABC-type polar amino acid transport system ATPase subunit
MNKKTVGKFLLEDENYKKKERNIKKIRCDHEFTIFQNYNSFLKKKKNLI